MLVDIIETAKIMQPGIMLYGRLTFDNSDTPETCLIIREEDKYIKKLGYRPVFTIRTGMLVQNDIPVVVLMLLINGNYDMLYESYWNYYQTGGGQQYFKDMATQERIPIVFVNQNGIAVQKAIFNSLKDIFAKYDNHISEYPAWTMHEFDMAKAELYRIYKTPEDLWEALGA